MKLCSYMDKNSEIGNFTWFLNWKESACTIGPENPCDYIAFEEQFIHFAENWEMGQYSSAPNLMQENPWNHKTG